MSTPGQIVLHIGYNKTGSSALQAMLSANRKKLASQGLFYPASGEHGTAHYCFSSSLIGLPAALPGKKNTLDQITKSLLQELSSIQKIDHLIISSEYFHLATNQHIASMKEWLTNVFPGIPVKILVYLRRHDKWFASAFNQAEKNWLWGPDAPYEPSISSFVSFNVRENSEAVDYLLTLDKWSSIFGVQNILVRSFDSKRLVNQCICDDFLSLLLPSIPVIEKPRVNESLSNEELLLAALWNRVVGKRLPWNQLCRKPSSNRPNAQVSDRLLSEVVFSQEETQKIVRNFNGQYKAIAEKYLPGSCHSLFDIN